MFLDFIWIGKFDTSENVPHYDQKEPIFMTKTLPRLNPLKLGIPILLMIPFLLVIAMSLLGFFMLAHADGGVAAPDLPTALTSLFGAITGHATAAVVIMYVFQVLTNHDVLGVLGKLGLQGKTLQIVIAVLTALGYVASAFVQKGDLVQALIEGLFTAGGAMLIYDSAKNGDAVNATAAANAVVAQAVLGSDTATVVTAKK